MVQQFSELQVPSSALWALLDITVFLPGTHSSPHLRSHSFPLAFPLICLSTFPRILPGKSITFNSFSLLIHWPLAAFQKDIASPCPSPTQDALPARSEFGGHHQRANFLPSFQQCPLKKTEALFFRKVHLQPQFGVLKKINSNLNSHWR